MTSALVYKEVRETLGIAALGLAALLVVAACGMGFSPVPGLLQQRPGTIPFLSDSFDARLMLVAAGLALALGFWQSIGDFRGDAQLFLLHRPVSRRRIYAVKLVTGLAIYIFCGVATILLYSAWAATPGTHASPFAWSMTAGAWKTWLAMSAVYLGAFLSGVRPAAWLGTRLAPLAAASATLILIAAPLPYAGNWALIVLADFTLAASIFFVVANRDFA
jgi:hypothetical protein